MNSVNTEFLIIIGTLIQWAQILLNKEIILTGLCLEEGANAAHEKH